MVTKADEGCWKLNLLGKLELRNSSGVLIPLRAKNIFVLLAYLVANEGQEIRRDKISEVIWDNSKPKASRNSLRNALAILKKCLPENVLQMRPESVVLTPQFIVTDWKNICSLDDYCGDFMPGLNQEWVIDTRIQLRESISNSAISRAQEFWDSGKKELALETIHRACTLDPLNEIAISMQVKFLEDSGNRVLAISVADAYRSKLLREIGAISDVRPEADSRVEHPLISAAEWLLDRNPNEAISLLAATHSQWLAMPIDASRDIHNRSLTASTRDSADRRLVCAQHLYLSVMSGGLTDIPAVSDQAIDASLQLGERLVAARMCGAFAYRYLSKGEFPLALSYALQSLNIARQTNSPELIFEFEQQYMIILEHSGNVKAARAISRKHLKQAGKLTNIIQVAQQLMSTIDPLVAMGQIDKAIANLDRAKSIFESNNADRMLSWVHLSRSVIYEAIGDNYHARAELESIQSIGAKIGGQAVTAMTSDRMAALNCKLGDYSTAAEALATSSIFRRNKGSVPSVVERNQILLTHKILVEKIGERDLLKTYQRVAQTRV